ncbi:ninjurin-B isoform X2 [Sitodiplosis mosellana]|uniref:ninjurin-B isoform X2 n=1 Tax=Sitodiplosis mosellana TaxID=263140 RepID=UPI0024444CB8|nr:ninjurin-B isoform X2 [Sitodiplosis mosellana]
MSTSNELIETPSAIEIDSSAIELKPVKATSMEDVEEKSIGLDTVDQGCVGCSTKDLRQIKEGVSLSISSDDETENAIPLKKSNSTSYRGMMDIALLTANANQLRFLITYNSEEKTFFISATLIILSLIVQVLVGIGLIYKRHVKKKGDKSKADKVGSLVTCGIFCLAVLNVLVVSFTTTSIKSA